MLLLAAFAVLAFGTPFYEAAFRVALAYGVLWVAFVPKRAIRSFNFLGDYSYGIICFPLHQTILMLDPAVTPLALFSISFPGVLGLAILSRHYIERPALSLKAWAGDCTQALSDVTRERMLATRPSGA